MSELPFNDCDGLWWLVLAAVRIYRVSEWELSRL